MTVHFSQHVSIFFQKCQYFFVILSGKVWGGFVLPCYNFAEEFVQDADGGLGTQGRWRGRM